MSNTMVVFVTASITAFVAVLVARLFVSIQKEALGQRVRYEKIELAEVKFEEGRAYEKSLRWFGLGEAAKAAGYYGKDKDRDAAGLAGVCGVCGREHTVRPAAEVKRRRLYEGAKQRTANIAALNERIAVLQAKIVTEAEAIAEYDREAAETQEIAERFGDLASDLAIPAAPEKAESIVDEEG